jgi:hypothetical protein
MAPLKHGRDYRPRVMKRLALKGSKGKSMDELPGIYLNFVYLKDSGI